MGSAKFDYSVFINCPFDAEYEKLLEAMVFCCVRLGFEPLLLSSDSESGKSRLAKIIRLIKSSRYSVHDLSRHKATKKGDVFRMNMPFELGIDTGLRESGMSKLSRKKFLVFESKRFDLKAALSDLAGQDPEFHSGDYTLVIKKTRDFLHNEAGAPSLGAQKILADYLTWQAWLVEIKIADGHSEAEALNLPTKERISSMKKWLDLGQPVPT
jgi:hypothetical protein